MRRLAISLILVIFLVSLVSAEGSIFIHEQPSAGQIYNLEEMVPLRTTITPQLNEGGSYTIDLMCNGIKKFIQGVIKVVFIKEKNKQIIISVIWHSRNKKL